MSNINALVPWVEKYKPDQPEMLNLPNALIFHNFPLITKNTEYITIKTFGIIQRRLVISPRQEDEVMNRMVVRIFQGKVTDPRALELFDLIKSLRIDFVESEGQYYQVDFF